MKLPNYEKVVINPQKFTDYILSDSHPIGKYKAAYFKNIGYVKENYHLLMSEILKLIKENNIDLETENEFGKKYIISGMISTPNKKILRVTTVWFIENNNSIPYFVTVYPTKSK